MDKKPQNSKKPQRSNLARLSGVGLQMGATIFIFAYAGKWLDAEYPMEKKWYTIGLTLTGVAISLYNVLRQVNSINDEK